MALSKFQKQFGAGNPVYVCRMCKKNTRDTGNDEGGLELCYRCLKVAEAENAGSDYGIDSEAHKAALAAIPAK